MSSYHTINGDDITLYDIDYQWILELYLHEILFTPIRDNSEYERELTELLGQHVECDVLIENKWFHLINTNQTFTVGS
jgi:hypothetical protein